MFNARAIRISISMDGYRFQHGNIGWTYVHAVGKPILGQSRFMPEMPYCGARVGRFFSWCSHISRSTGGREQKP